MANYNCDACSELREDAPNLIVNGLTNTECASLKNNTGLNPSSGNDNCTDLDNLNDCLIGNMEAEIDAYDVCDWKEFMSKYIENSWTVFKAIICAVCGLWANISGMLARLTKLECIFNKLGQVQNFAVGAENIKWFNGVIANPDASTDPDLSVPRIIGNAYCGYMTGSIVLPSNFEQDFPSSSLTNHGVLLYEYRIKKSDFDLRGIYAGNLQEIGGGSGIHAHVNVFNDNNNPPPWGAGNTGSASYTVPSGWIYLQVRITSYDDIPNTGKCTLAGVLPILMNPNNFDC